MKEIHVDQITAAVETLCMEANYYLPKDVYQALERAKEQEASPLCRQIIGDILKNADIAASDRVPICQDTGLAVFFLEVGQDVHICGGALEDAINLGVHRDISTGTCAKVPWQTHCWCGRIPATIRRPSSTPDWCRERN